MRFGGNNTYLIPTWMKKYNGQTAYTPDAALTTANEDRESSSRFTLKFENVNKNNVNKNNTDTANPDLSAFLFYNSNSELMSIYDAHNVTTEMIQNEDIKPLGLIKYTDETWLEAYLIELTESIQIQMNSFINPPYNIEPDLVCELWYQENKGYELLTSKFTTFDNKNWYCRIATVVTGKGIYNQEETMETTLPLTILTLTIIDIHNELFLCQ